MALLFMTVVMVLCYVLGMIFSRFDHDQTAVQTFLLISVVNSLYVGMPVAQALCGSEGVFYVGLSSVPFNILLYTWGMWALRHGKGKKGMLSLLIFVIDLHVPKIVSDLLGSVASATVPISMLVIGATLGNVSLSEAFSKKKIYLILLLILRSCFTIISF